MVALLTIPPARAADAISRLRRRLAAAGYDLPLRLWDGQELGPASRGYRLVLEHPWSLRAMVVPPTDLQTGETYVSGAIDVEGSMVAAIHDVAVLRATLGARERLYLAQVVARLPAPPRRFGGGRVTLNGRRHAPQRDAAAVRHHYDVGNDFYRLLLDDDLVYSCGYFSEQDRDALAGDRGALNRAQSRKLELICRKLALRRDERFLDVGCGWGSLVIHAARHHGVRAIGVTLSEQQAALARERVAAAGLEDRVTIRLADYREVRERFDAVASVGMVEHVGADQLRGYVRHLYDRLRVGGRLLNHGITTGGRNVVRDLGAEPDNFVGRHVFPDGALVPDHLMVRLIVDAGFEVLDVEQLRPHYAKTLRHWVANLENSYDDVRRAAGEAPTRVWRAYFAASVVGFETNDLGVIQILAAKGEADLPFGRERMLLTEHG